jgi:hypothetical protein
VLAGRHGESGGSGGRGGECWHGSRCPHQPPALFIDNLRTDKKECFFQVFQYRAIEVELSIEGAIDHVLMTPEQVNDVVEQGIKVYRALPSTTREGISLDDGAS